jgi:hypothetical protein
VKGWIVESSNVRQEFEFLAHQFPELKESLTRSLVRIMLKEEFSDVPSRGSAEDRTDILRRRLRKSVPWLDSTPAVLSD